MHGLMRERNQPLLAFAGEEAGVLDAMLSPGSGAPLPASMELLLGHSRTLLLQGPMGPFFRRLCAFLQAQGQTVWKVNFNGGDRLFFGGKDALSFRGTAAQWPAWLERQLRELGIDAVVLFGQSRPLHRQAVELVRRLGIAVYVFEEGYLRPNYVTLERGGVNAASSLPREAAYYLGQPKAQPAPPLPTGQSFRRMALYAMLYSTALLLGRPRYRHHEYHRPLHPVTQAACWVRGGLRKLRFQWSERHELRRLCASTLSKRWFLMPLQVHNDSQLRDHSRFRSVEEVIETVLASFAAHAPADRHLVFKHHPMDRAYCDFGRFIARRASSLGIGERVSYVHDVHLPMLLKHACGVVTVNSTTGLQAMYHGTPVHTLGDCLYAIPGLVHQGDLAAFWHEPGQVDSQLYWRFRNHLVQQTQLNASFYGTVPAWDGLWSRRAAPAPRASDATRPGGALAIPRPAQPGLAVQMAYSMASPFNGNAAGQRLPYSQRMPACFDCALNLRASNARHENMSRPAANCAYVDCRSRA